MFITIWKKRADATSGSLQLYREQKIWSEELPIVSSLKTFKYKEINKTDGVESVT